jgi:hypothetical protein
VEVALFQRSHHRVLTACVAAVLGFAAAGAACSPKADDGGFDSDDDGEDDGSGAGSGSGSSDDDDGLNPSSSSSGVPADQCDATADEDRDQDGITKAQGDCNDCDANVGPGSVEVIGGPGDPPVDEDCNNEVDEPPAACDTGIDVADGDPRTAAKAIELCRDAADGGWGVIDAAYVKANGTPYDGGAQRGIVGGFGPNVKVQNGASMLVLSSGAGRLPNQPGACAHISCVSSGESQPPAGFPAEVPGCDGGTTIYDDVGLEVKVRAPKNATGYAFNFKFYSFEFAEWVCTTFNDQFIALVTPPPMGAQNGNIVFDNQNNPVSVNVAFFDVCDPVTNDDFAYECEGGCPNPPAMYCPAGPAELVSTGFDNGFGSFEEDAGATVWLETNAPVTGGEEVTIRFAIWDTGDNNLDSTVLVDSFRWTATPGTEVGTTPVPDPK